MLWRPTTRAHVLDAKSAMASAVSWAGGPSVADEPVFLHHAVPAAVLPGRPGPSQRHVDGTLGVLMLTGGCLALLYTRIQRAIGYAGVVAVGYGGMAAGFLLLVLSPPMFLTFAGAAWRRLCFGLAHLRCPDAPTCASTSPGGGRRHSDGLGVHRAVLLALAQHGGSFGLWLLRAVRWRRRGPFHYGHSGPVACCRFFGR